MATVEPRSTIHAVIAHSGDWYSGECVELPVVTQGRTLDETVANLRDAIGLHLEAEELAALGFASTVTLHVSFDSIPFRVAAS